MNKQEVITLFIDKGYLLSPDFFELKNIDIPQFIENFNKNIKTKEKPLIIHKDRTSLIHTEKPTDINWLEFEKSRVMYEKGKNKMA